MIMQSLLQMKASLIHQIPGGVACNTRQLCFHFLSFRPGILYPTLHFLLILLSRPARRFSKIFIFRRIDYRARNIN